jgi:HNH endonuclease
MMAVDPLIADLTDVAAPHIEDATTMKRFGIFHPTTVFEEMNTTAATGNKYQQWSILGVEMLATPRRLRSFEGNLTCVCCGRAGNAFLVERHVNDTQVQYLNLYSITKGEIVLMTVDHILPDSMGGKYSTDNFQTMCRICNLSKRNLMSESEVALVRANVQKYAKAWMHPPYLLALLDLQDEMRKAAGPHHARLLHVFDTYRKRVKFDTKPGVAEKHTVALRKAIKDAAGIPAEKVKSCPSSSVSPVAVLDSIKGSWNARMKRWSVFLAEAKVIVTKAAKDLRTARKKLVSPKSGTGQGSSGTTRRAPSGSATASSRS